MVYSNSQIPLNEHHSYLYDEFLNNQEVTDEIYDIKRVSQYDSAGILYHVCPKNIWENKILKTGMLPKSKRKYGRYYPPRIYFYRNINGQTSEKYFQHYAKDLAKSNNYKDKEWVVLKINLNKNHGKIRFFEDQEYPLQGISCFTYDIIHPRAIEKIMDITID